jgi:uncharacterized membrane protein YuzA (DUF378 family)
MKQQASKMSVGVRALFGVVGIAMLISATHEIWVGEFSNHGSPVRMAEQPIAFWLYMGFKAILGIAGLYALAFGNQVNAKEE